MYIYKERQQNFTIDCSEVSKSSRHLFAHLFRVIGEKNEREESCERRDVVYTGRRFADGRLLSQAQAQWQVHTHFLFLAHCSSELTFAHKCLHVRIHTVYSYSRYSMAGSNLKSRSCRSTSKHRRSY